MKSIKLLLIAVSCVVSPLAVPAQTPVLLRTFTVLTGGVSAEVAALGNDRVLIGGSLLFNTNGTLLTNFTVTPSMPIGFGGAITTLGNDRVVIGSTYGGNVYLFTTNGALVTNISVYSVSAVVGVGNDKLLIGDNYANENPDTWDVYGAAYLYSTNGALLTTFTNPNPGAVTGLGFSVAAFGSDRVLIGASTEWPVTGSAYLFRTNGTMLMTFTNPAPSIYDYFGHSIAAVGTDRVLVGSPAEGTPAEEVYLFNTNGTLLTTITNPTPAAGDRFGWRMAVLGNDRVVIGAPHDDTTGVNSGSAYVFSLNGTLLATINNPSPGFGSQFGRSLAAFGNESVIIGTSDGSAYLFSIPGTPVAPSLTIRRTTTSTVVVSWPSAATDFTLQQNTNGLSSANWSNVTAAIQDDGTNKTLVVSPTGQSRFYQLVPP